MKRLIISEIFGPTIQGEGELIGTPCLFIRAGGCDFRCRWCDTQYAVLPQYAKQWQAMTTEAIIRKLQTLAQPPVLVVLSGGNPALQDFRPLIMQAKQHGYRFSIETQASYYSPWLLLADYITISPKPPSAGVPFDYDLSPYTAHKHVTIKCVIADNTDYLWAKKLVAQYPHFPLYLQPVALPNETTQERLARLRWLVNTCLQDNYYNLRLLPQLHTLLWSDTRGV